MKFEDWAAGRMEVPDLRPFTMTDHGSNHGFFYPGDYWIELREDGYWTQTEPGHEFLSEDLPTVERWLWDNLVRHCAYSGLQDVLS